MVVLGEISDYIRVRGGGGYRSRWFGDLSGYVWKADPGSRGDITPDQLLLQSSPCKVSHICLTKLTHIWDVGCRHPLTSP